MKNNKKNLMQILFNIFLFLAIFITTDFSIYQILKKDFIKMSKGLYEVPPFKYALNPTLGFDITKFFDGSNNQYKGRAPDGVEFNENPIIVFGCSFAHGQFLNKEQTFSYKLSQITKRPVYNRAISGKGLQTTYYQVTHPQFYKDVPKSNTIIYIMINDHYRRMMTRFINPIDTHFAGKYYINKFNKISEINFDNKLIPIFLSSYTVKLIHSKFINSYINNPQNAEKLTNDVIIYLKEIRSKLEKNWQNKIQFSIIFFDEISHKELLTKKLVNNNFNVIDITELTTENLYNEIYYDVKTMHPTEATWDLLTPKIIEKLEI